MGIIGQLILQRGLCIVQITTNSKASSLYKLQCSLEQIRAKYKEKRQQLYRSQYDRIRERKIILKRDMNSGTIRYKWFRLSVYFKSYNHYRPNIDFSFVCTHCIKKFLHPLQSKKCIKLLLTTQTETIIPLPAILESNKKSFLMLIAVHKYALFED